MAEKLIPFVILLGTVFFLMTACGQKLDGDGMVYQSYRQISQEVAREMMEKDDGHVVVDVRRQEEYDAGHIPGAILIPNESIGAERPEKLPDPEQIILIYCRSGNRSKHAAQKLFDAGYTNIFEFGGIIDWTGEIVTEETEALNMEKYETGTEAAGSGPVLAIEANGHVFHAVLEDNSSAEALVKKLGSETEELELHDYGSFEKVGALPWTLLRNDVSITTVPGDVILYQGNQITIYYDENTWNFTRLAKIEDVDREELLSVFGEGNVTVKLRIEQSK